VKIEQAMTNYLNKIRDLVGSDRIFVPGVRAIILNEKDYVLLQYRADMSLWGIPSGSVEPDESAIEALKREVKEETCLKVLHAEPMALHSGPQQRFIYPNGDEVQCFAITFIVRRWEGRPQADGLEGLALQFFPLSKLPKSIFHIHRRTLDDYLRYEGKFLLT